MRGLGHPSQLMVDTIYLLVLQLMPCVITPAVYVTRGARRDREDIKYQQSQSTQLYTNEVVASAHADKDSSQHRCCRPAERERDQSLESS